MGMGNTQYMSKRQQPFKVFNAARKFRNRWWAPQYKCSVKIDVILKSVISRYDINMFPSWYPCNTRNWTIHLGYFLLFDIYPVSNLNFRCTTGHYTSIKCTFAVMCYQINRFWPWCPCNKHHWTVNTNTP